MSRLKGSKNKPKEVIEDAERNWVPEEKEEAKNAEEAKIEPLGPGQKYFETPEGIIAIGEANKDRLWVRSMNNGRGGWANPKR